MCAYKSYKYDLLDLSTRFWTYTSINDLLTNNLMIKSEHFFPKWGQISTHWQCIQILGSALQSGLDRTNPLPSSQVRSAFQWLAQALLTVLHLSDVMANVSAFFRVERSSSDSRGTSSYIPLYHSMNLHFFHLHAHCRFVGGRVRAFRYRPGRNHYELLELIDYL